MTVTGSLEPLSALLAQLGCPAERVGEMAVQLDRRARQLAEARSRPYEEALQHLLRMMAGGWNSPVRGEGSGGVGIATADGTDVSTARNEQTGMSNESAVRPWTTLASRPVGDFRIFTMRSDVKENPRTGRSHDFYVIECVDWVNVIALTRDGNVVMVDQYRHGSNTVELEVPGGMLDAEERDPVAAGLRELREETGYVGENARLIGSIFPNAAIMTNTCYTLLVENCVREHEPELDAGEDLETRLIPLDALPGLVAGGKVRHALVAVALYHFDLWRRGLKEGGNSASGTPNPTS